MQIPAEPRAPSAPPQQAVGSPQQAAAPQPAQAPDQDLAVAALVARLNLMAERLRQQEGATASLRADLERIDSSLQGFTRRAASTLEALSADLARASASLETLRSETVRIADRHDGRLRALEQRSGVEAREVREMVDGRIEAWELTASDSIREGAEAIADRIATFEERAAELLAEAAASASAGRTPAGQAAAERVPSERVPPEFEDLSLGLVQTQATLAATRATVEFLRAEVGSLAVVVKRLVPGAGDALATAPAEGPAFPTPSEP